METQTQERSTTPETPIQTRSITSKRKDGLVSLVDANRCILKCSGFARERIQIPSGKPDYDDQEATPREEQSFSELYQNIKTKLVELYYRFRLKLTNIGRYLPR